MCCQTSSANDIELLCVKSNNPAGYKVIASSIKREDGNKTYSTLICSSRYEISLEYICFQFIMLNQGLLYQMRSRQRH